MYTISQTLGVPVHLALIAVLTFGSGCGGFGTLGSLEQSSRPSVISQDEAAYANAETAYDIVEHLRPQFFAAAGGTSFTGLLVYINGIRAGGSEVLRGIAAGRVKEIRLLSPREATLVLGSGHSAGALMVKLRSSWSP
ncbi:MAG: hypothetical protein ACJ8AK_13760 [Gemmatimonadaceae bacterium]